MGLILFLIIDSKRNGNYPIWTEGILYHLLNFQKFPNSLYLL